MSKKGKKTNNDYLNTANGCISAEHALPLPENLEQQIEKVVETFPQLTKEIAAIILQSNDCNLLQAIDAIGQDGAEKLLASWNTQGKGRKTVSQRKKKRNKPNRNPKGVATLQAASQRDTTTNADESTTSESQTMDRTLSLKEDNTLPSAKLPNNMKTTPQRVDKEPVNSRLSTPDVSATKIEVNDARKKPSNSIRDTMPRSVKDLQRSAVAIARFNLVLHENFENAEKNLKESFRKIRESVDERERLLADELINAKTQAVSLLDGRQESAASLKHQCDRIYIMKDEEVVDLKLDIKNFIGDRKIDEQITKTCVLDVDCPHVIQTIQSFGQVNNVKANYRQKISPSTLQQQQQQSQPQQQQPLKQQPQHQQQQKLGINSQSDTPTSNPPKSDKPTTDNLVKKDVGGSSIAPLSSSELRERSETHEKLKESLIQQRLQAIHDGKKDKAQTAEKEPSPPMKTGGSQPRENGSPHANSNGFKDVSNSAQTQSSKHSTSEQNPAKLRPDSAKQQRQSDGHQKSRNTRKSQRNGDRRDKNFDKPRPVRSSVNGFGHKEEENWRSRPETRDISTVVKIDNSNKGSDRNEKLNIKGKENPKDVPKPDKDAVISKNDKSNSKEKELLKSGSKLDKDAMISKNEKLDLKGKRDLKAASKPDRMLSKNDKFSIKEKEDLKTVPKLDKDKPVTSEEAGQREIEIGEDLPKPQRQSQGNRGRKKRNRYTKRLDMASNGHIENGRIEKDAILPEKADGKLHTKGEQHLVNGDDNNNNDNSNSASDLIKIKAE